MRLVIPPECQIGARTYRIVYNDWLLDKLGLRANCSSKDQKIYLHTGLTAIANFEDLAHELTHIASWTSAHEIDEATIKGVSNILTQALLSLGIEPDFSQIPKEKL